MKFFGRWKKGTKNVKQPLSLKTENTPAYQLVVYELEFNKVELMVWNPTYTCVLSSLNYPGRRPLRISRRCYLLT